MKDVVDNGGPHSRRNSSQIKLEVSILPQIGDQKSKEGTRVIESLNHSLHSEEDRVPTPKEEGMLTENLTAKV
jgi:hypothetical protein